MPATLWAATPAPPNANVYDPGVILETLRLSPEELYDQTGWELKPEGACKEDRCVPLPDLGTIDGKIDVTDFARRMGMPLAHDEEHGVWALGPESGGHVLRSAQFPDLVLPGFDGESVALARLRGRKVLLVAWASY